MKKHISLLASAAIVLGMISGFSVTASAADIPVSISSAVKTSYSVNTVAIGNNAKLSGYTASESDISDFVKKVNAAALGKIILPVSETSSADNYQTISGSSDSGYFYVARIKGKYFDCFCINGNYYPMNSALDKAFSKIVGTRSSDDSIPDRMLKYTVECSEPKTEKEYYNAAASLVGAWLDTLKKETGEYKLGSYSFNGKTLPTENDIVRGEGLISGGREFCCTIGFDVKGISKESVFAQPKNSGYNKFYDYYKGPVVVVRCRWENGVCSIVDYGSGGDALTKGLNGIRTNNSKYDTLFDFYRDTKQVEKLDKEAIYYTNRLPVAATSPVFMSDGRIGYVAIYPRESVDADKNGVKTAEYDNGYFDENCHGTYTSPVDFKDGDGAQRENFHEKFNLVFDDYNCDGNADFALKQSAKDETADGAMYEVRCMSNDMTPRSDRFSFFMAGRHEESIRLQHADRGGFVYWSKDSKSGKLYTNSNVDDYRMYSERYYLPAEQRIYDDEKVIYCFFWNNTEKDVKVGGKYHIEYNKNGEWVSVSKDKALANKTAKAYYDTELKFDISGIKQRNAGEYRIVMKVNGKTVYGGFYIGSRAASITVTAEEKTVPKGTGYVSLTVKNTGTEPVRLTNAYIAKNGKKVAGITVDYSLLLAGGEKRVVAELDRKLAAGKYTVKIAYGKKTASCNITIKKIKDDALTSFGGKCTVKESGGKLTITVKNNKYTKETVKLGYSDIGSPEVLVNGIWTNTGLTDSRRIAESMYSSIIDLKYGETTSFTFSDPYDIIMSDPEMLAQLKELYDSFMKEMKEQGDNLPKEYEQYKNITLEEFINLFTSGGKETIKPSKNSLYRMLIGNEYVYFIK